VCVCYDSKSRHATVAAVVDSVAAAGAIVAFFAP